MDRRTIRELLAKYYQGETTDREEQLLRYYFHSGEVAEEFKTDQEIFRSFHDEKSVDFPSVSFEKMIDEVAYGTSAGKHRQLHPWLSSGFRVAASLLIVAALSAVLYIFINHRQPQSMEAYTLTDPKVAYAEAKKALHLVSENLNKGTDKLQKLESFNYGVEKMNTLSIINRIKNN